MREFEYRRRRSIRLRGYDYSQAGAYFVTICAEHGLQPFGRVFHGGMQLNLCGMMVQSIWNDIPLHCDHVAIDEFVIMPNHLHGIIVLLDDSVGAGPRACPCSHPGQPRGVAPTDNPSKKNAEFSFFLFQVRPTDFALDCRGRPPCLP
jgi:putative transposase